MGAVIVNKTRIFADANPRDMRGASMLEVLLALGVVTFLAPFVYKQITDTTHDIQDISAARTIFAGREAALNFVRMNQDRWPDYAQIKLAPDELAAISDAASAGFIDKYMVRGAAVTDVYLGFAGGDSDLRTSKIVRQIGTAAAMVGDDGVAYGDTWAVAAPDFQPGDLVYRISRDFSGEDKSKYLHRGTSGEDDLNVMMRDLDMGQFNVYDISTVRAQSAKVVDASTVFVTAEDMAASNVFFVAGANMDGNATSVGSMRVTGDVTGFRTITADRLNGEKFTTTGRIITDRASVNNSINVGRDLILKSDSLRTISGFDGISVNGVHTPFLSAQEMIFYDNFGLTVSGELLYSTNPPLKIGSWTFPSTTPPSFKEFNLSRATIPAAPVRGEFDALMSSSWKDIQPAGK